MSCGLNVVILAVFQDGVAHGKAGGRYGRDPNQTLVGRWKTDFDSEDVMVTQYHRSDDLEEEEEAAEDDSNSSFSTTSLSRAKRRK